PNPNPQPFGILVRRLGERVQSRPVELLEQLATAYAQPSQRLGIELLQGSSNRPVALLQ
ncbi:hypothetical protein GGE65_008403, partial [Skermanella aerolata]